MPISLDLPDGLFSQTATLRLFYPASPSRRYLLDPAAARAGTSAFIPDQKMPYALNWTLGVQHVIKKNYTLEVRYVGTRGVHLLSAVAVESVCRCYASDIRFRSTSPIRDYQPSTL